MNPLSFVLVALLFSQAPSAQPRRYQVATEAEPGRGITVQVPYSFGTHQVAAHQVEGEIQIDPESLSVQGGPLRASLFQLKSDDPQRDCHMREGLGLDYSRSRFPKDHVCDAQNRLPNQGNDAVAFPYIELRITNSQTLDDPRLLNQGREVRIVANGTWVIHGIKRPASLQLTVSDDLNGAFRVRGRQTFVLSDFGVQVKSASVAIFSSSVRGEATAIFNLRLEPAPAG
jgi:polyisoprenoid-binding protein YceI